MSDHPQPHEMGHGYGETAEQHAAHTHSRLHPTPHWGLTRTSEKTLFYTFFALSLCLEIVASVTGSLYSTDHPAFIATVTPFLFFSWAAWWQTVVGMMQRASWVRDESSLGERRAFLHLAVRLNQLMFPTCVIAFVTFLVAYPRRFDTDDLCNWLLFLLIFILNIVGCVMNAYNNITWEIDRLEYEEGESPYGSKLFAILGIPSSPKKSVSLQD